MTFGSETRFYITNISIKYYNCDNSRNSGSIVEWKENFREKGSESLVIPREVVLFLYTSSSPPFVLRDSRESETRAPHRVSSFLAWGDFHARSRFAPSTIPEYKTFFVSLLEVVENLNSTFWLNGKRPIFLFFFF